jgi:hypothetical protein
MDYKRQWRHGTNTKQKQIFLNKFTNYIFGCHGTHSHNRPLRIDGNAGWEKGCISHKYIIKSVHFKIFRDDALIYSPVWIFYFLYQND